MTARERDAPEGASETPQEAVVDSQKGEETTRQDSLPSTSPANDTLTNGDENPDLDPSKDDSEAETVLSSPVKRREALRRTNGVKSEPKESHASIDAALKAASPSLKASVEKQDGTNAQAPELKVTIDAASPSDANPSAGVSRDNNDESDGDSDLSDPDSVNSRSPSGSPNLDGDESEPRKTKSISNPKKRKYRDTSLGQQNRASSDATKRLRRTSANTQPDSDNEEEETSPAPRQRRHRRTRSSQLADDHEDSPEQIQTGRTRRATSSRPAKEDKALDPVWDSDSDSEASALPTQNRSTRGQGRSTSTPGRPLGREHKRHVNKYGLTRLAEACEGGDMDGVKEWLEKDPGSLEVSDNAGNAPLQIAALNGYPEVVKYLLENGCNKDCANSDNDTPLIDATENGHTEVVEALLAAGVDPLHQNRKGQQALDVITDEVEDGVEIREMLKKAIEKRQQSGIATTPHVETEEERTDRLGPKQVLHFMARTPENLLKLVANNDRKGVIEFLNARVAVDNNIVAAAAKTGDLYLLNLLLVDMHPRKAKIKAEKPMLAVLGTSHFDVVKVLTELEHFDPLWKSKSNGMTWYETAEDRSGPHWKQEHDLLLGLYKEAQKSRTINSSPVSEMKHSAKRHKSPPPPKGSDGEAEEPESPDAGRGKRRLLSRKKLRAAPQKSASVEPAGPSSSPEAVVKPEQTEEPVTQTRKTGRTRTKSLSSQAPPQLEGKTRRIKATRENIALFDSAQNSGNKSRKPSTSSNSRPAAESVNAKKAGANGDDDTNMTDTKAEDEKKEAEEEASREQEAARQAAEKQERVEQRAKKLEGIPSALRHALQMQGATPTKLVTFLASHFLPLQAVDGSALGFEGASGEVPWMLNYQAAGLLRGLAAEELLEMPSSTGEAPPASLFADFEKHAVSTEHRKPVQMAIGSTTLADQMPPICSPASSPGVDSFSKAEPRDFRARIVLETERFGALQPLYWLKVRDFLTVKAALQMEQAAHYPHLEHLPPLEMAFDTRLDAAKFPASRPGTPARKASLAEGIVDQDLRTKVGQGLKEGDGRSNGMFTGGTKKVTQVDVVVE